MKKTLLGLGSIVAIAAPVATVISCGSGGSSTSPIDQTKNEAIKKLTQLKESANQGDPSLDPDFEAVNREFRTQKDLILKETTVDGISAKLVSAIVKVQAEIDTFETSHPYKAKLVNELKALSSGITQQDTIHKAALFAPIAGAITTATQKITSATTYKMAKQFADEGKVLIQQAISAYTSSTVTTTTHITVDLTPAKASAKAEIDALRPSSIELQNAAKDKTLIPTIETAIQNAKNAIDGASSQSLIDSAKATGVTNVKAAVSTWSTSISAVAQSAQNAQNNALTSVPVQAINRQIKTTLDGITGTVATITGDLSSVSVGTELTTALAREIGISLPNISGTMITITYDHAGISATGNLNVNIHVAKAGGTTLDKTLTIAITKN